MAGIYSISIYDHSGSRISPVKNWSYLEFTRRISSPHNHVIRLETSPDLVDNTDTLELYRDTLERDFIIQVVRRDPYGNYDTVYEGFNRTIVDQTKKNGVVVFTLYGTGYTNLLKRRIILPDTGEEESAKTGVAETVMKEYVDEACINPLDVARVTIGLRNEPDGAEGAVISMTARYENLYNILKDCADLGQVDFGIVRDSDQHVGEFEFQTRALWGEDRRIGNTDGNTPQIFSVEHGNMEIPIFSKKSSDEITMAYIGGPGQGDVRVIETITKPAAADTPWNRIEIFIDARKGATSAERSTIAGARLAESEYKPTLTFNIKEITNSEWLRNFDLGDIVSARYGGTLFGKKLISNTVIVSSGSSGSAQQEVISFEMEEEGTL